MADLGAHTTFFATNFPSTFSRFLRSHLGVSRGLAVLLLGPEPNWLGPNAYSTTTSPLAATAGKGGLRRSSVAALEFVAVERSLD
jgi:hypothetical protein